MRQIHTQEHAPQTRGRTIGWARPYDWLVSLLLLGKEHELREMTARMADIKLGDKVLDIGCGTGNLTLVAQAHVGASGEVHGIDPATEMIAVAQEKAARSGAQVYFQLGVIEDIPFPDDYFDVVLSSLTIHHLPDDLKREGFTNIKRVLKPGGRLFIVDFEPPDNPVVRFLLAHIIGHDMMQVDVREYVPMLQAAGFDNVEAGRTQFRYISFVKGRKS